MVDKCIYLDSDTIVCQDLAELFLISMEGYEIAGVKAPSYHQLPEQGKSYREQTGLPSMGQYVNAGVLLLNLKLLRTNQYSQRAILMTGNYYPSQDQDIINLLSYGKIKLLPFKYNVPALLMKGHTERLRKVFTETELEEGKRNPYIIHYAFSYKPWEFFSVPFAEKWWEVCKKTVFFMDYLREKQDLYYYYGVICQKPLWRCAVYSVEWYNEMQEYSEVYVYGAGKVGEKVIRKLQQNNVLVKAALVSRQEDNGSMIAEVPVIEFSNQISKDVLIILGVSEKFVIEIRERLFQDNYFNVYIFQSI